MLSCKERRVCVWGGGGEGIQKKHSFWRWRADCRRIVEKILILCQQHVVHMLTYQQICKSCVLSAHRSWWRWEPTVEARYQCFHSSRSPEGHPLHIWMQHASPVCTVYTTFMIQHGHICTIFENQYKQSKYVGLLIWSLTTYSLNLSNVQCNLLSQKCTNTEHKEAYSGISSHR